MVVSLILNARSLDDSVRYILELTKGLESAAKLSAESYEWKFAGQFRIWLEIPLSAPVSAEQILSYFPKSFEKVRISSTNYEVEFIGTNQRLYNDEKKLALHEWVFLDITLDKTEIDRIPKDETVVLMSKAAH